MKHDFIIAVHSSEIATYSGGKRIYILNETLPHFQTDAFRRYIGGLKNFVRALPFSDISFTLIGFAKFERTKELASLLTEEGAKDVSVISAYKLISALMPLGSGTVNLEICGKKYIVGYNSTSIVFQENEHCKIQDSIEPTKLLQARFSVQCAPELRQSCCLEDIYRQFKLPKDKCSHDVLIRLLYSSLIFSRLSETDRHQICSKEDLKRHDGIIEHSKVYVLFTELQRKEQELDNLLVGTEEAIETMKKALIPFVYVDQLYQQDILSELYQLCQREKLPDAWATLCEVLRNEAKKF